MNHFFFYFLCGLMSTLFVQALQHSPNNQFETVHSLTFDDFDMGAISQHFAGDHWLENRLVSEVIDINSLYQKKAFTRELKDNSTIKRRQLSYGSYIEERICNESPYMDKPVRARMTSRYGYRVHPLSGRRHIHAGIDFRGDTGTPVYASSPGKIKAVGRKGAYGKAIVIDHGNSFTSLYGHLSAFTVKKGQWVNMGQTIGYIGSTGRTTGPHLHFEIRCHNVPLNPRKYLGKMGKIAEVKFKKSYRRHSFTPRNNVVRAPARDPNYYTRMINLQKLQKLQSASKKF